MGDKILKRLQQINIVSGVSDRIRTYSTYSVKLSHLPSRLQKCHKKSDNSQALLANVILNIHNSHHHYHLYNGNQNILWKQLGSIALCSRLVTSPYKKDFSTSKSRSLILYLVFGLN